MKAEGREREWKVEEKSRAVLAVWTERGKMKEICKEMGVNRSMLSQWQERAMEGMLEALEPRGTRRAAQGPALGNKVRQLLERKARQRESGVLPKLERKIRKLQEEKAQATG